MKVQESSHVDQNLIKFSQACTIALLVIGFVIDQWLFVAVAATCQLLSATGVSWAPYPLLYRSIALPSGIVKANPQPDHHQPHRFAALVGGLFDLAGVVFLLANVPVLGWGLVAIVFVLANLNLWVSWCAGCQMYYLFNRFGVPGFVHAPTQG